jgi:hypothetical protein
MIGVVPAAATQENVTLPAASLTPSIGLVSVGWLGAVQVAPTENEVVAELELPQGLDAVTNQVTGLIALIEQLVPVVVHSVAPSEFLAV